MRAVEVLLLLFAFIALFDFQAQASPAASSLKKHLNSVIKWTRAAPKTAQDENGDHLQFESGYLVETLVEGNKLGVVPHSIRVSPEGELFVVDSENSNIVRITPPLSQYSRTRFVAGSFQGYSGHVDGKPSDARFSHPKGVTMDDKGNVYVADTSNLAIRKIGESGVTTIAGGKSNVAGYRDGPSEDAKFSTDFDVLYVKSTCSLLVIDRGNAALRQISLQQDDCDYQSSSMSISDILLVVGAVLAGYASCLIHVGSGPSFLSKKEGQPMKQEGVIQEKPKLVVESLKEDPVAGWPSFGTLISDLLKFGMEALGGVFLNFIPQTFRFGKGPKQGLTPLKDRLVMPEDKERMARPDEKEPSTAQKQQISPSMRDTLHVPNISSETPQLKPQKTSKSSKSRDTSASSKHRSSRKQDYAEFYGSGESSQLNSKSQKERVRHRHRDKTGEVSYSAIGSDLKSAELKSGDYSDSKFDHYHVRSKFGSDSVFRF